MSIKKITLPLLFLGFLTLPILGQISMIGKMDSLGLRQGKWLYQYTTHDLVPTGQKTWVIANYVNDTLSGEYRVISNDSTFQYFFNIEKNEKKGYAYFLQNGKIRQTFFYIDNRNCFVSDYDNKGRLFRTYVLKDEKQNGSYMCFEKGKITIKRTYSMGAIINEEINLLKKK